MWLTLLLLSLVIIFLLKLFFGGRKSAQRQKAILERHVPADHYFPGVTILDTILRRKNKSRSSLEKKCYDEMTQSNKSFCWTTEHGSPRIILTDLELVKDVMIKHFDHFTDNQEMPDFGDILVTKMLSFLEGEEWRGVRKCVSPTFTTGKIKRMMNNFNRVGEAWVKQLKLKGQSSSGSNSKVIDVRSTVSQFTIDVIASTVFGIEAGTVQNPGSTFSQMAQRIVCWNTWKMVKFTMSNLFPGLLSALRISLVDKEAVNYFVSLMDHEIENEDQEKMDTFLGLLLEARRKNEVKGQECYLTDDTIKAQCLVFFFAGFNTVSIFQTFVLYALAVYPEVQQRVRDEIDELIKVKGQQDQNEKSLILEYEDLGKLEYLDMVLNEVLRKYGQADRLERRCSKDFFDTETGLVVAKGTTVCTPVELIHHDKRYYERADEFWPEHFSKERKASRSLYAFLPFGIGPRNCIGVRFAMAECKVALVHLLSNFIVKRSKSTPMEVLVQKNGHVRLPPDGLQLTLVSRF